MKHEGASAIKVTDEAGGLRVHLPSPVYCGFRVVESIFLSIPRFYDCLDQALSKFNGDAYSPECIIHLAAYSACLPAGFVNDLPECVIGNVAAIIAGWLDFALVHAIAGNDTSNADAIRECIRAAARQFGSKGKEHPYV